MRFSAEPIPADATAASAELYGPGTPFRHWEVLRRYVSDVVARAAGDAGGDVSVSYGTTVELVEKAGEEWEVTLRREQGEGRDYWWAERFDAVVVASGHYNVPYVPAIEGLDEFQRARPGSVLHSKYFRGRDQFRGKRWEDERVAARGDSARFTLIHPEFEEYFEELRGLAGEGLDGCGRKLPRFDPEWARLFMAGHELRKDMWRRINAEAAEDEGRKDGSATAVSRT
ncbi:hypothetical protein RB597_000567 [Gaeumannomyces tritici]